MTGFLRALLGFEQDVMKECKSTFFRRSTFESLTEDTKPPKSSPMPRLQQALTIDVHSEIPTLSNLPYTLEAANTHSASPRRN